jgi:hypothetical protein
MVKKVGLDSSVEAFILAGCMFSSGRYVSREPYPLDVSCERSLETDLTSTKLSFEPFSAHYVDLSPGLPVVSL